jgi:hypothetical protein
MGLVGQSSNRDFDGRLARLTARISLLEIVVLAGERARAPYG